MTSAADMSGLSGPQSIRVLARAIVVGCAVIFVCLMMSVSTHAAASAQLTAVIQSSLAVGIDKTIVSAGPQVAEHGAQSVRLDERVEAAGCHKLTAVPPARKSCRKALGVGLAGLRSRASEAVLDASIRSASEHPNWITALIGPWGQERSTDAASFGARTEITSSTRAPFWAVFADAPRLRN